MSSILKNRWRMMWAMMAVAPTLALAQYAEEEQVCRDTIRASAPDQRYTLNSDSTVTDKVTGLIWKQCAEGLSGADCLTGNAMTFTWQEALQHAAKAEVTGASKWRLPNVKELHSLVEPQCLTPALNSRLFPHTPSTGVDQFWSSTPGPARYGNTVAATAQAVCFRYGDINGIYRNKTGFVRLVRDAD